MTNLTCQRILIMRQKLMEDFPATEVQDLDLDMLESLYADWLATRATELMWEGEERS